MLQKKREEWQVKISRSRHDVVLFSRILEIRARLDAQEKEINNLQKEKEALSQKHSNDPEIIK